MSIAAYHLLLVKFHRDISDNLQDGLSAQRRDRMLGDLAELLGRLQALGTLWSLLSPPARWLAGGAVRRCLRRLHDALDILDAGRPLSLVERDPCP